MAVPVFFIFHQRPPEAQNLPTYGGLNIMGYLRDTIMNMNMGYYETQIFDSIPYSSHNSQIVMGVILILSINNRCQYKHI